MKIGTLDQVLTGRGSATNWERHYALAAELGFDGLELGLGADYAGTQAWSADGRQALRQCASQHGVETSSLCLHAFWPISFASEDETVRQQAVSLAHQSARVCAELGARHILVPLTCPEGVPADVGRERWVAGMRASAAAAEDQGVILGLENVGRRFANDPEIMVQMVDAIGSPAVQVYYDPGNACANGRDPLRDIAVLGQRIRQVHVKERDAALLGDGTVPWAGILPTLRALGYDGWLVLETDATAHPPAAAGYNLLWLRKLLGEAF